MLATYATPGNWVDIATHHQNCSQLPGDVEAFVFTQDVPPRGWNPAQYGHAQWPMSVLLVDKLPSAHQSAKTYKVAILYRPTNLPSGPNVWLGYPGESGRIWSVCCGPSDDRNCIVGSRIEPCAHGATILKLGCVIPHDQVIISLTG